MSSFDKTALPLPTVNTEKPTFAEQSDALPIEETPQEKSANYMKYLTQWNEEKAVIEQGSNKLFEGEFRKKRSGTIARLGNAFYNSFIANTVGAITGSKFLPGTIQAYENSKGLFKEDFKTRVNSGKEVTEKEVQEFANPESDTSSWAKDIWDKYQKGKLNVSKYSKSVQESDFAINKARFFDKAKIPIDKRVDISVSVNQAKGLVQKGVDLVGGVSGQAAQLLLLKKAMPGLPAITTWELQSEINGGTPGMGAINYLAFSAPTRLPISGVMGTIGKTMAQSASLGGVSAVEQLLDTGEIDNNQIYMALALPLALRTPSFVKAGWRLKSGKVSEPLLKEFTPEVRDTLRGVISPDIQQVKAVRVMPKKALPSGTVTLRKQLPSAQKLLPMTEEEAITRKARDVYDGLLTDYERGSKPAGQKLARLIQGQNFPTLNELYERVNAGDKQAAEAIQKGMYSGSPESIVLGLKEEARKVLKIPKEPLTVDVMKQNVDKYGTEKLPQMFEEWKKSPEVQKQFKGLSQPIDNKALEPTLWETFNRELTAKGKTNDLTIRKGGKIELTPEQQVQEPIKPKADQGLYTVEILRDGKVGKVTPSTPQEIVTNPTATLNQKVKSTTDELLKWVKTAKRLNSTVIAKAKKQLRKQQAGGGTNILNKELEKGTSSGEAINKSSAGYKRNMQVQEYEPPKLSKEQWGTLEDKILDIYPPKDASVQFQRTHAQEALNKIKAGKIPTVGELEKLIPIIGEGEVAEIGKGLGAITPLRFWELPKLAASFFKLKVGTDLQVARQGSSYRYRNPLIYGDAIAKNAQAYASEGFAKAQNTKLRNSPGWADSTKHINYVSEFNFGSKRLPQFSLGLPERLERIKFKSKILDNIIGKELRATGKLFSASERGAATGINTMLKGLWDESMEELNKLNLTPAQELIWKKNRGEAINTFMKMLRAKNPDLKKLQELANLFMFSPSMTVARPWSIKVLLANKGSRLYAADVITRNIAGMHATSYIAQVLGNQLYTQDPTKEHGINGETNPVMGNYGKQFINGTWYDFSGGDAAFYRTIARLGVSAYMAEEEIRTGKQVTEFMGNKIPSASDTFMRYAESREAPIIGFAKAMITGKDWMNKPISGLEEIVRSVTPATLEDIIDAGRAKGLWGAIAAGSFSGLSASAQTYDELPTAIRRKFKDYVANKDYKSDWNLLSPEEQKTLEKSYKAEFKELDEKVKVQYQDTPYNPSKAKEEEKEAGVRITKKLTPESKTKLGTEPVGLNRSPGDFYLNDKRYNEYQDLVAKNLNSRLDKLNNPSPRTIRYAVEVAKKQAFVTLKRTIKDERTKK